MSRHPQWTSTELEDGRFGLGFVDDAEVLHDIAPKNVGCGIYLASSCKILNATPLEHTVGIGPTYSPMIVNVLIRKDHRYFVVGLTLVAPDYPLAVNGWPDTGASHIVPTLETRNWFLLGFAHRYNFRRLF